MEPEQEITNQQMKGWRVGNEHKKIEGASGVLRNNTILLETSVT